MYVRPFGGFLASIALLSTGCLFRTVEVEGYNLDKDGWENAQAEVRQRASFELRCPKEQLKLTLLAAMGPHDVKMNAAKQIGVDGCGHRLVYVDANGSWVLNSSDGEAK